MRPTRPALYSTQSALSSVSGAERDHGATVFDGDVRDLGVEIDGDAEPRRHLLAQRVADLGVEMREQPRRDSSRA